MARPPISKEMNDMKKTRVLLLACACLLTLAAARPAKSDACLTGYFCQDCSSGPAPEQRLCKKTICNGVVVAVLCSSQCTTNCILPPG